MKLGACLDAPAERMPLSHEHFARDLPMRWVETALKLTDTATEFTSQRRTDSFTKRLKLIRSSQRRWRASTR